MAKLAITDHPVNELISRRWSPKAFSNREIADSQLRSLFEAARWAASSFNEQPWAFVIARKQDEEEYKRALACLSEKNAEWARTAPVIFFTFCKERLARNDKPNFHAAHDLGMAMGNFCAEATARGLLLHQMGGILRDEIRQAYSVPEGWTPVAAAALGYAADPADLDPGTAEQEKRPRTRKPLSDMAFSGLFGAAANFLQPTQHGH